MNIPIFPKPTCPSFYFWKSDFPEFIILVICQIRITSCLWVVVFVEIICFSDMSESLKAVNFHQPRIWVIVCGIVVATVLIHILFASILHKGVHENRMAYVAVWLTLVLICWIGAVVQFLFATPWAPSNVVSAAGIASLLLPVLCSLRSIQKRKERNWTLNVHC